MQQNLINFYQFEKEYKLFQRKYNNVYYWQGIRSYIYRFLFSGIDISKSRDIRHTLTVKKLFDNFFKLFSIKKNDILYFDQRHYRLIDNQIKDIYFDYFFLEPSYTVQRCFYQNSLPEFDSIHDGIGISIPRIGKFLFTVFVDVFPSIYKDHQEDKYLDHILSTLIDNFSLPFSAEQLYKRIIRYTILHKIYKQYYRYILKRSKPKSIFVVCHYDELLFPLYEAASDLKIPVIELQHGMIFEHDAYTYLDLSPEGKPLPNYLFTYGDFWSDNCKLPSSVTPIAVGNAFLENRRNKYQNIIPDNKTIIFYSTPLMVSAMEQLLLSFLPWAEKNKYHVILKLHPSEHDNWKQHYPELCRCSFIEIINNSSDIYELFSKAEHHVAIASTVIFEAAVFPVKTYIYHIPDSISETMRPLINMGLSHYFKSSEELTELLSKNVNTQINEEQLSKLWKHNAIVNIQNALSKIMI